MSRHYLIRLPWPDKRLSSNARVHWRANREATAKARFDAGWLAKEQSVTRMPNAVLQISYHPPSRHKRDAQNIPAMLKPYIDGIADAMGCDDNGFRVQFPDQFGSPVKGGCVLVHIKEPEAEQ